MSEGLKVAVVTPYYIQTEALLRACQQSVLNQTYPCTHIAVADGHPQPFFAGAARTLHVILPQANRDYGNTPRAFGAMLAESYGFDAVAWLDDDNWLEPEHLETMVAAHHASGAPLIACQRILRHLNGEALPVTEPLEDHLQHVDANCWLVCRPAFPLFQTWRVPKSICHKGDRVFFQTAIRGRYPIVSTRKRTVNYRTKYPDHYRRAGLPVPPGAYTESDLQAQSAGFRTLADIASVVDSLGFFPNFPY
jgi:hypothetical protein